MLSDDIKEFGLLKSKWNILKEFVQVLQVPYDATISLQSNNCTLSDFYGIWLTMEIILKKMIEKKSFNTNIVKFMIDALLKRKSRLIDHPAMLAAIYIDPRFRSEILKNDINAETAKTTIRNIAQQINNLKFSLGDENSILNTSDSVADKSSSFEFDARVELDNYLQANESHEQNSNLNNIQSKLDEEIRLFTPAKMKTSESVFKF